MKRRFENKGIVGEAERHIECNLGSKINRIIEK